MLFIPYLIWVGYGKVYSVFFFLYKLSFVLASALTMAIWQLNSPYAQPPPRRPRPARDPNQQ